jgi:hypothetical protein
VNGEGFFFFCLDAKETKKSSLQIKSVKTTSKCRSAARVACLSGSSRGLLPLYFFFVFLCFVFKGGVESG